VVGVAGDERWRLDRRPHRRPLIDDLGMLFPNVTVPPTRAGDYLAADRIDALEDR
jgi:hypothetical protein